MALAKGLILPFGKEKKGEQKDLKGKKIAHIQKTCFTVWPKFETDYKYRVLCNFLVLSPRLIPLSWTVVAIWNSRCNFQQQSMPFVTDL